MTASHPVENPEHIHPTRVRRISVPALAEALGRPSATPIPELRRSIQETRRDTVWPVRAWAAAVRETETARDTIAEATRLLESQIDVTGSALGRSRRYGFHYLPWLKPLVDAYALTADVRYVRRFEELFDEWTRLRDEVTGEWPGLDVIWYSLGICARCIVIMAALDVFGSELADRSWAQLMTTVLGGARWTFDEHGMFRHGNWQLVAETQLLHVALVFPQFTEAAAWREQALERLVEHLDLDFYPDGGHYERSPGYHELCLENLQLAAVADRLYGQGTLAAHPKFAAAHHWIADMTTDGGWAPHFQDSTVVWPGRLMVAGAFLLADPEMFALARRWLDPEQLRVECARLPELPEGEWSTDWSDIVNAATDTFAEPGSKNLSGSDYVVMRTGGAPERLSVTVSYGPSIEHELESHSHPATLDLVMAGWGVPLLWEAGGPITYDDPDYYGWFRSSRGHNTVLVDGRELDSEHGAQLDSYVGWSGLDVLDAHHVGNGLRQTRRAALVGEQPRYLVIDDAAELASGHDFEMRLHTPSPWTYTQDGTLRSSGAPGIAVAIAGGFGGRDVHFGEGPSRVPDPDTREAPYSTIHSVGVSGTDGTFRTVVVPFETEPPVFEVADDGGVLTVAFADVIDEFRANSYTRTERASGRLRRAATWNQAALTAAGTVLLEAPFAISALLEWSVDGVLATMTVPRRCSVRLTASSVRAVKLNDVAVPFVSDAGGVRVIVPAAGTWAIEVGS